MTGKVEKQLKELEPATRLDIKKQETPVEINPLMKHL
jgi:hypothetical protein